MVLPMAFALPALLFRRVLAGWQELRPLSAFA